MSNKLIYSMHTLPAVRNVVTALIAADIPKDDIALIARSDIEMEKIPDQYRDASTDFAPAAMKGALGGGTAGLIAGLVAMVIPPFGISIAGAAAIATIGAMTGTWTGAMVGSSLTDPVRRRFEEEIEAGRILIVVDTPEDAESTIDRIMQQAGATHMTFEDTILTS